MVNLARPTAGAVAGVRLASCQALSARSGGGASVSRLTDRAECRPAGRGPRGMADASCLSAAEPAKCLPAVGAIARPDRESVDHSLGVSMVEERPPLPTRKVPVEQVRLTLTSLAAGLPPHRVLSTAHPPDSRHIRSRRGARRFSLVGWASSPANLNRIGKCRPSRRTQVSDHLPGFTERVPALPRRPRARARTRMAQRSSWS